MLSPLRDQILRRSLVYASLTVVLLLGALPIRRSTWLGSAELHTLLETISFVLAASAGAMALVRFYTKKSGTFLLLGNGFLGAALLDGYHAVVTSSFLAGRTLSAISPWSGTTAQLFLSLLMCASLLAWKRETMGTPARIKEGYVYFLVGAW
jgi:hypothetical protein